MTPSAAATYERARRLANIALWTVKLQRRRLQSREPEDGDFQFRRWADFQYLIVALTRIRRAAVLASRADGLKAHMQPALSAFDKTLPNLKTMRDAAEHFDDYALDVGRNSGISRKSLEVGIVSETDMSWPSDGDGGFLTLNADKAEDAAEQLFAAIRKAEKLFPPT